MTQSHSLPGIVYNPEIDNLLSLPVKKGDLLLHYRSGLLIIVEDTSLNQSYPMIKGWGTQVWDMINIKNQGTHHSNYGLWENYVWQFVEVSLHGCGLIFQHNTAVTYNGEIYEIISFSMSHIQLSPVGNESRPLVNVEYTDLISQEMINELYKQRVPTRDFGEVEEV